MKTVTEKRYFVTTKFEKYGTYTIMARSKEHAIQMWKDGDWNFDDYESDYGEYNEVIDDVEEEVFADTQLSLEGVMQPVKCNPIEHTNKMEKLTHSKIIGMSDAELKDYIKQGFADVTEHDMIDKELYYRDQRRILID